MRVVVTGATGNIGTSVVERLLGDSRIESVVGIARRRPEWRPAGVDWVPLDIAIDDLEAVFDGADAVVHLAWLIQPSHDERKRWATNVAGTARVVDAVVRTGVPTFVAASSIGAYSPAPAGTVVDESWPTDGIPESPYSWQKAIAERSYGALRLRTSRTRTVVLRPAVVFKRPSARHVRHLFLGPFVPVRAMPVAATRALLHRSPIPFQVVHADDVASATHLALQADVEGPFNLAAVGVIGHAGRSEAVAARFARGALGAAWRLRLAPADPGWVSLAEGVPIMTTDRATTELGWTPQYDADAVLTELLEGFRQNASFPTPPLAERRVDMAAVRQPAQRHEQIDRPA